MLIITINYKHSVLKNISKILRMKKFKKTIYILLSFVAVLLSIELLSSIILKIHTKKNFLTRFKKHMLTFLNL